MNQIITEVPFGDGTIEAHLDTSGGEMEMDTGHIEGADLTVTLDYATAKAILVDGNPQAGMQAFMAGKIKVQGDMTKMMAMQSGTPDPVGRGDRRQDQGDHRRLSDGPRFGRSSVVGQRWFEGALRGALGAPGGLDEQGAHHPDGGHQRGRACRPRRRPRPRRPTSWRTTVTVCISWIPSTTPSWVIICWKAPATPRSRSSTALAMLAASAGDEQPRPTPDSASDADDHQVGRTRRDGGQRHHRRHHEQGASHRRRALPDPDRRRIRPAGRSSANASGRAIISAPTRVSG